MKKIKLNNKLLLSASVLLVLAVVLVIVIRRRGRKVAIVDPFRLNNDYEIRIYDAALNDYIYWKGTLDYVVLAPDYKKDIRTASWEDGNTYTGSFYPVIAVGEKQPSGKIKRVKLQNRGYIQDIYVGFAPVPYV